MKTEEKNVEKKELLKFPCSYPLKVIGKNTNEFYSAVSAIIERHLTGSTGVTYASRTSNGDKYLSITAAFSAESQEQLAAIYEELSRHEQVLFTL